MRESCFLSEILRSVGSEKADSAAQSSVASHRVPEGASFGHPSSLSCRWRKGMDPSSSAVCWQGFATAGCCLVHCCLTESCSLVLHRCAQW